MTQYDFKFRKYAIALYEALKEDAFYQTMENTISNGSSREAMIRYMDHSMDEGKNYGELFIPGNHDYGVSVWSKPIDEMIKKEKYRRKTNFIINHMGKSSLETYNSIVDFMSEKARPLIDAAAWYLSIIGILPGYQGQGLGVGLVKRVTAKTDSLNIPTYLETFSPRSISFYNRIGYEVIDCFHEPTTDAKYWLMHREAENT